MTALAIEARRTGGGLQQALRALHGVTHGAKPITRKEAEAIRDEIVELISHEGHGRLYRRGTRIHRASAPGAPPALDYGDLAASFRVEPTHDGSVVTTDDPKARLLEYGTSRMAARPFFRVVAKRHRGRLRMLVVEALARAVGP